MSSLLQRAVWLSGLASAGCLAAAEPAVITLAARVEVDAPVVRLADVIETEDLSPRVIEQVSAIDLVERRPNGATQVVSRKLIELRLRLAGIDDALAIAGPDEVLVMSPQSAGAAVPEAVANSPPRSGAPQSHAVAEVPMPRDAAPVPILSDADIERAAAEAIATQLNLPLTDLRATLTTPVADRFRPALANGGEWRLEVVPLGERLLGRITCMCRIFIGPQLSGSQQISLLVERRYAVLVTTASLERGQTLTTDVLREEVRYLTEPVDELKLEQVTGGALRTALRPGQILSLRHLAAPTAAEQPVVVQPRQMVRVIAAKPGLQVVLRDAQAMEQGRVGDMIRVRNEESGRVIVARVSGPGAVEVALH